MGKVCVDITMSLDGFIAGPNDEIDPLHDWLYGLSSWREPHGIEGGTTDPDSDVLEEAMSSAGAIVIGRRMHDLTGGWGDNPPFQVPLFVVTHRAVPPQTKANGTTFTFVTDGIESALAQAQAAAGDRNVAVGGGASTIQQILRADLVDEMQVHIAPVLLGRGIRLFEEGRPDLVRLEANRVLASPNVTHLRYRVR